MSRHTEAPATIRFLETAHRGRGATWEEIAIHFGLTRIGVRGRIYAARRYMIGTLSDKTIPRPTGETGWRYTVTDKAFAPSRETSVAQSSVADFRMISAMSDRLVNDFNVAWQALSPQERQSMSGQRVLAAAGAFANVSQTCRGHDRALSNALARHQVNAPATR